MTLHNTAEFLKKAGIASSIALGAIIVIAIFFRIGVVIKNIMFPPKIEPANQAFGKIPPLEFPQSTVKGEFEYSIDTPTQALPEFADRLIVYPIINPTGNLLNLETVKKKVTSLGFVDNTGTTLLEIPLGGDNYQWEETTGLQRKIIYDTVSLNFTLSSEYLKSNTVIKADSIRSMKDEKMALETVQGFLNGIEAFPPDIDLDKTNKTDPKIAYLTKPQLYSIIYGELTPTTSLSRTQVIRVDIYQKDINYTLTAGTSNDLYRFQDFELKLPILYPYPPYSTMNFLVASGETNAEVVSAKYTHQTPNLEPKPNEPPATYPIKTSDEAFNDLKAGNGYIAGYKGNDSQILIDKVYLAYFLGEVKQEYLMPVVVFEGPNGFFAYVSAVKEEALE